MEAFYFYTEGLTVGYEGVPLIKNIGIRLEKGRDSHADWAQRGRQNHHFKKHYPSACAYRRRGLA